MSLDSNIKAVQKLTRDQGVTALKADIIKNAENLGLDMSDKMSTEDRAKIASQVMSKYAAQNSQITTTQEPPMPLTSQDNRQPMEETAVKSPAGSLSVRDSGVMAAPTTVQSAILEIRQLQNPNAIAQSNAIVTEFAMGFATEAQTIERLLGIIDQANNSLVMKLAEGIVSSNQRKADNLKALRDTLKEQNDKALESMLATEQEMKDIISKALQR